MMHTNRIPPFLIGILLASSTCGIAACHLVLGIEEGIPACESSPFFIACGDFPDGGTANAEKDASDDPDINLNFDAFMGPRKDFPDAPIVVPSLPLDIPSLFGADVPGGVGPCLVEPPIDAMFPTNWTPPLFEWNADAGQNAFELRLHVDNQVNDLVVYTDQSSYALPLEMWNALATASAGHDISISVRSAEIAADTIISGPFLGTTGTLHIAPVPAPGSVVYWTTTGGSALKGFTIGASDVTTVLTPADMNDGTVPQLFVSAMVTSIAGGTESIVKTYPAVYVTTQPADEANHTPAWDVFQIQPPK